MVIVIRDIRFVLRGLTKKPAFTAIRATKVDPLEALRSE
jgi:hypothetical protein